MNRLYKILLVALFSLGVAIPAFGDGFGDDIGLSFLPKSTQEHVRVDARSVEDIGDRVLVEPKDRVNNSKLSGLIRSLHQAKGKRVKGTFRIRGKKLYKVIYIFDDINMQLKVRVNNINYIISELRFLED